MEKKSFFNQVTHYGLITGLILIAYSLFTYIIGQSLNRSLGYLSLLILAVCIYLFSKQYRDKINEGSLRYGEGFKVGLLTGFFAAILVAFYGYLQFTLIDPSLLDKQLQMTEQEMLARGMTEENVEAALAMSKKWMTPAGMFFMGIISVTFWSAIIALITSAILKKDPSPFNQNSSNE